MTLHIKDNGEIQIPEELLDRLNIQPQDILRIETDTEKGCIIITKT